MPSVTPPISSVRVHVEGIGPVLFERSAKAKHISIRIKPLAGVRVAVPLRASFEKAQEFLLSKKDWIKHHLHNVKTQENKRTVYSRNSHFHTFNHTLQLQAVTGSSNLKARVSEGTLLVTYPAYKSEEDEEVQEFIRQAVEATY
ncbi:MAG: DUF45 domain-containing protein, partial [Bacteroidota bacterium]|nr:DUF45 domain-containing protein [Bacteroidota bacterium]